MKLEKSSSSNQTAKEKQSLIMIIRRYQENPRFKDFVSKNIGIKETYNSLNKKSIPQLQDLLERIRVQLDNRNVDKIYDSLAKSSSQVYETVLSDFYDIDGFTDNLFSQENFLDCLEKIKIETNLPHIPPYVQMGYIVLQTTILTHEVNKMKRKSNVMESPEYPSDLLIEDNDDEDDEKNKSI